MIVWGFFFKLLNWNRDKKKVIDWTNKNLRKALLWGRKMLDNQFSESISQMRRTKGSHQNVCQLSILKVEKRWKRYNLHFNKDRKWDCIRESLSISLHPIGNSSGKSDAEGCQVLYPCYKTHSPECSTDRHLQKKIQGVKKSSLEFPQDWLTKKK